MRGAAAAALLALAAATAPGCAARFFLPSRPPGTGAIVVEGVPTLRFGTDRCGPGALSEALAAIGDPVSPEDLASTLPQAPGGGVLSVDLLIEARRRGHVARLEPGDYGAVERTLRSGLPAIAMLRISAGPGPEYYHYVVLDGIDPQRRLLRAHLGDGRARWMPFGRLDKPWAGAGRAMLVVSRSPLPAEPDPAELREAVALEDAGRLDEAAQRYRDLLARTPRSPLLLTDLGNVESARGNTAEAEKAYRAALAASPADPDALNNLAWLLYRAGDRLEEAESLARRAVEAGGPDPWLALDTLGRVQAALGRCDEAIDTLTRAAREIPAERRADLDGAAARLEETRRTCGTTAR